MAVEVVLGLELHCLLVFEQGCVLEVVCEEQFHQLDGVAHAHEAELASKVAALALNVAQVHEQGHFQVYSFLAVLFALTFVNVFKQLCDVVCGTHYLELGQGIHQNSGVVADHRLSLRLDEAVGREGLVGQLFAEGLDDADLIDQFVEEGQVEDTYIVYP